MLEARLARRSFCLRIDSPLRDLGIASREHGKRERTFALSNQGFVACCTRSVQLSMSGAFLEMESTLPQLSKSFASAV